MTSFNTYLDTIKPYAKSFQQKATKTIDALDGKLKKTQQNLEKSVVICFSSLFEIFYSDSVSKLLQHLNQKQNHAYGEHLARIH